MTMNKGIINDNNNTDYTDLSYTDMSVVINPVKKDKVYLNDITKKFNYLSYNDYKEYYTDKSKAIKHKVKLAIRAKKNKYYKVPRRQLKIFMTDKMTDEFKLTLIVLTVIIAYFVILPPINSVIIPHQHNIITNNIIVNNQSTNNLPNYFTTDAYLHGSSNSVVTYKAMATPTITPAITTTNSSASIAMNNQALVNSGYLATPTPLPPMLAPNNQNIGDFDSVKVNGINTNYVLQNTLNVNSDSNYNIDMLLTNMLSSTINSLSITITAGTYYMDYAENEPALGQYTQVGDYTINGITINHDNTYELSKSITIPNQKGTYLMIININSNNGGNCKITQLVTIN